MLLPGINNIIERQSYENKMVRNYKRKTDRGSALEEVMKAAAADVANGKLITKAAADHGVNQITLSRYITRQRDAASRNRDEHKPLYGYRNVSDAKRIFATKQEVELSSHAKELANQFHGLSAAKLQALAYEFATQNGMKIPQSWHSKKQAGRPTLVHLQNIFH